MKGQLAELNRRLALTMSKLDIKDEASKAIEDLLQVKMQEARDACAKIDILVETRKAALEGDLKKLEAELFGSKS